MVTMGSNAVRHGFWADIDPSYSQALQLVPQYPQRCHESEESNLNKPVLVGTAVAEANSSNSEQSVLRACTGIDVMIEDLCCACLSSRKPHSPFASLIGSPSTLTRAAGARRHALATALRVTGNILFIAGMQPNGLYTASACHVLQNQPGRCRSSIDIRRSLCA